MSCDEAAVEVRWKLLNDGAVMADRKLPEIFVIYVRGESTSLQEVKSQVNGFLATQYPASLEESLAATRKYVGSINVVDGDLEGDLDLDFAELTEGPGLGRRAIIRCNYGHFCEACSVVNKSDFSSM